MRTLPIFVGYGRQSNRYFLKTIFVFYDTYGTWILRLLTCVICQKT